MSLGPGSSLRKRFPKTFFSFYSSGKKHWVDKRSKRVDGGVIFLALPALERNAERKKATATADEEERSTE